MSLSPADAPSLNPEIENDRDRAVGQAEDVCCAGRQRSGVEQDSRKRRMFDLVAGGGWRCKRRAQRDRIATNAFSASNRRRVTVSAAASASADARGFSADEDEM